MPKTKKDTAFPKSADGMRWDALSRGQIISVTTQKFFNYVQLADQKAQLLIIVNSILVPISLSWSMMSGFTIPALVSLATSFLSVSAAIICIYPKRRAAGQKNSILNPLHFADIGVLTPDEFSREFMPVFNDPSRLSEVAVHDLHDTARFVILPKFKWLKISYGIFFVGNFIATIVSIGIFELNF